MAEPTPISKHALLNRMLTDFAVVQIYFDARDPRSKLPAHLVQKPHVVFDLGLALPVPIQDFKLDNQGVYGAFSFKTRSSFCFVPWGSIFAVLDKASGQGALWRVDMPSEIVATAQNAAQNSAPVTRTVSVAATRKPNHLRLVK